MTGVSAESSSTTRIVPPRRRTFLRLSLVERCRVFLWLLTWHTLFRFSPSSLRSWRNLLLRAFGATIGRDVFIAPSVRIDFPWRFRAANDVCILHCVIINCIGEVSIGAHTRVSHYAHLCAGTHDYQDRAMPIVPGPIHVGRDVWIAADAFVGPGVSIGDGALLAARSSAFRDLPAGMVCVGEPARPVKPRTGGEQ